MQAASTSHQFWARPMQAKHAISSQWLQTVRGYIVDAVEPITFIMLAMMACSLIAFDRLIPYLWIGVARLKCLYADDASFSFDFGHEGVAIATLVLPAIDSESGTRESHGSELVGVTAGE